MPDIDGILRKEDFDTDTGLRGLVRAMMASLAPAISDFAVQNGIELVNGGRTYPILSWKERYTIQEDGRNGSIMKQLIINPARDLQGGLCVKVIPSAMKVLGRKVYSHDGVQDAFTQASEGPLLGSLKQGYNYLRSLKPADINQLTDAQVL